MRILLVEDDPITMFDFIDFLEKAGHHVDHASTKDKAINFLNAYQYDVAAIDLVLVASTGDTVAQKAYLKGVGVVLMSASEVSIDDTVTTLELKGIYVSSKLKKPITPRILLMALEEADRTKHIKPKDAIP